MDVQWIHASKMELSVGGKRIRLPGYLHNSVSSFTNFNFMALLSNKNRWLALRCLLSTVHHCTFVVQSVLVSWHSCIKWNRFTKFKQSEYNQTNNQSVKTQTQLLYLKHSEGELPDKYRGMLFPVRRSPLIYINLSSFSFPMIEIESPSHPASLARTLRLPK